MPRTCPKHPDLPQIGFPAKFCYRCGERLVITPDKACEKCGGYLSRFDRYCPACGAKIHLTER